MDTDTLVKNIRLLEQDCFEQPWSLESIHSALEHGNFVIFVGEEGQVQDSLMSKTLGNIFSQGYAIGRFCQADAWIELLRLGVRPRFRRQGLAKRVLKHLEFQIVERCFKTARAISIELRAENLAAKGLYQDCGYELFGQRLAYYQDGADALIMRKVLKNGTAPS